jgi:hypothetical protein
MRATTTNAADGSSEQQQLRHRDLRQFRAAFLILIALVFSSVGTALIFESIADSQAMVAGLNAKKPVDNRDARPVLVGLGGGGLLLAGLGAMFRGVSINNR